MAISKQDLLNLIDANLPDNNSQYITAEKVREVLEGIVNSDFNKIDDRSLIGLTDYKTNKSYVSSECVVYNNDIYRCIVSNSTVGAFNPSQWQIISTYISSTAGLSIYIEKDKGIELETGKKLTTVATDTNIINLATGYYKIEASGVSVGLNQNYPIIGKSTLMVLRRTSSNETIYICYPHSDLTKYFIKKIGSNWVEFKSSGTTLNYISGLTKVGNDVFLGGNFGAVNLTGGDFNLNTTRLNVHGTTSITGYLYQVGGFNLNSGHLKSNGNDTIVNGKLTVTDTITAEGIVSYTDDFSNSFEDNDLVSKKYVDNAVNSIDAGTGGGVATLAGNGLTKVGNTITLGGTLNDDTDIDVDGKVLSFGNANVIGIDGGSISLNTTSILNMGNNGTAFYGLKFDNSGFNFYKGGQKLFEYLNGLKAYDKIKYTSPFTIVDDNDIIHKKYVDDKFTLVKNFTNTPDESFTQGGNYKFREFKQTFVELSSDLTVDESYLTTNNYLSIKRIIFVNTGATPITITCDGTFVVWDIPSITLQPDEKFTIEFKEALASGGTLTSMVYLVFQNSSSSPSVTTEVEDGSGNVVVDGVYGYLRQSDGQPVVDWTSYQGLALKSLSTGSPGVIKGDLLSDTRSFQLPDQSGTFALAENVKDYSTAGLVRKVNNINPVGGIVTLTTSNIAEGSNLYFTDARVNANNNVVKGVQGFVWGNHSTAGYVKKVNNITPVSGNVTLTASNLTITTPTLTNSIIVNGDTSQVAFGKLQAQINNRWGLLGNGLTSNGIMGGTSGNYSISLFTNNKPVVRLNASSSGSGNNYITISNGLTNVNPLIETVGSDTNVALTFKTKSSTAQGNSYIQFDTGNVSASIDQLNIRASSSLSETQMCFVTKGLTGSGGFRFITGATTALAIGNSGTITITSVGSSYTFNGGTFTAPSFKTRIGSVGTGSDYIYHTNADTIQTSTGTQNYRSLHINYTINTTGGTSNIFGVYFNPVLTSQTGATIKAFASDLVASSTSNYNLYMAGTALNYINGNTSIGTTTATASNLTLGASTTSKSSLRILSGTAPTSPQDGDIWYDGTNIKIQVGGTTKTFTIV